MRAFPSWFLRIECERCGKVRMLNEAHATDRQRHMQLRDLLARARHEGCGGRAAKMELLTGVEGISSRPVRRIVLGADNGSLRRSVSPAAWINTQPPARR